MGGALWRGFKSHWFVAPTITLGISDFSDIAKNFLVVVLTQPASSVSSSLWLRDVALSNWTNTPRRKLFHQAARLARSQWRRDDQLHLFDCINNVYICVNNKQHDECQQGCTLTFWVWIYYYPVLSSKRYQVLLHIMGGHYAWWVKYR